VATAQVQDDKLFIQATYFDDVALERNKQIRNAGFLDKGKLGLHENEDIRLAVSCPSVEQWNRFRRLHPETYELLMSKNEALRMKGARQLQLVHPEWVVQSRL
jgi:hypothetical protein